MHWLWTTTFGLFLTISICGGSSLKSWFLYSFYRKEKKSRTLEERGSKGEDSHYLNRLEEVKHENFNLSAFLNYIEKTDGKPPANLITANMYEQLTECKFNQVSFSKNIALRWKKWRCRTFLTLIISVMAKTTGILYNSYYMPMAKTKQHKYMVLLVCHLFASW